MLCARRWLIVATAMYALCAMFQPVHASAGGSWMDPVKDRYEPGDQVTMVGYTGGGAYGWVEDGPFFAHVQRANATSGEFDADAPRHDIGELEVLSTGDGGYLNLRVSVTFEMPADAEPGLYLLNYCNADCSELLGHLIGGRFWIGVDPDYPPSREWALDDPEIANLDDDALLSGPGVQMTAGQLRAGDAPEPGADGRRKSAVDVIATETAVAVASDSSLKDASDSSPKDVDAPADIEAPEDIEASEGGTASVSEERAVEVVAAQESPARSRSYTLGAAVVAIAAAAGTYGLNRSRGSEQRAAR